jgi:hypothetical protein
MEIAKGKILKVPQEVSLLVTNIWKREKKLAEVKKSY